MESSHSETESLAFLVAFFREDYKLHFDRFTVKDRAFFVPVYQRIKRSDNKTAFFTQRVTPKFISNPIML